MSLASNFSFSHKFKWVYYSYKIYSCNFFQSNNRCWVWKSRFAKCILIRIFSAFHWARSHSTNNNKWIFALNFFPQQSVKLVYQYPMFKFTSAKPSINSKKKQKTMMLQNYINNENALIFGGFKRVFTFFGRHTLSSLIGNLITFFVAEFVLYGVDGFNRFSKHNFFYVNWC